jgi:glycosyltransferase involved in cell wall biosynthesis
MGARQRPLRGQASEVGSARSLGVMVHRMRTPRGTLTVLVIGSLPPPLGGCSVTLQFLVEELQRRDDVEVRVLDTKGIRGRGVEGGLRLASAVIQLARQVRAVDLVTLHVATTAIPGWGLLVLALASLAGRPFILRKFAGTDYRRLGFVRGRVAHFVVRHADTYLVETRAHLETSRGRQLRRVYWFPTARPLSVLPAWRERPAGQGCRRFAYVGHVSRLKGLGVLAEAMKQMPPDASLDVYGPWLEDLPADLFAGQERIRYHGPIPASEVVSTMARHDALVLPSLATTEGYPGSVLEAYAAGLPVIASRIGAIPEIVDESAGLLVEPGSVTGLRDAMMTLYSQPTAYLARCVEARTRAGGFSSQHWCERFVSWCREAVGVPTAA